jgi:hypothetical protein
MTGADTRLTVNVKKRPPRPRDDIFDLYWRFAAERQLIFERRVAGESPPWTSDPTLSTFKFCNVFRAADRVSQYLIRSVAFGAAAVSPADRLFQIAAFRTFSKPLTWESVRDRLGNYPTIENLRDGSLRDALTQVKERNGRLYTGAFILCATSAFGHRLKHLNHIELFTEMFLRNSLAERLLDARSLQEVFELLRRFPLMGDFMSYQTAIDLNYSSLINFSEDDFTCAGPGAIRGLRKVFLDLGEYSATDAIMWMVERQELEFRRRELPFSGLWGRRLHAIDCQGLFCEVDKYCREAAPELVSGRTRIKARFSASSEPISLFFPSKWGINHLLPAGEVLGRDAEKGRGSASPHQV